MCGIQNFSVVVHDARFDRAAFAPGALGAVGNLRFKKTRDATPPAAPINPLRKFGLLPLEAGPAGADPARRPTRRERARAYHGSRCIGDLLGSLTARADDPKAWARVAGILARFAGRPGDGLSGSFGGREALRCYLGELLERDLEALRGGPLGDLVKTRRLNHPPATSVFREAVLDEVCRLHGNGSRAGRCRVQAGRILDQVVRACDEESARRAFQRPVREIGALLSWTPVDTLAVGARLRLLRRGQTWLGAEKLYIYVNTLSNGELKDLLRHADRLDAVRPALNRALREAPADDRDPPGLNAALDALSDLSDALHQETWSRVDGMAPGLIENLKSVAGDRDPGRILEELIDLGEQVEVVRDAFETPPLALALALSEQVSRAVNHLFDLTAMSGERLMVFRRRVLDVGSEAERNLRALEPYCGPNRGDGMVAVLGRALDGEIRARRLVTGMGCRVAGGRRVSQRDGRSRAFSHSLAVSAVTGY